VIALAERCPKPFGLFLHDCPNITNAARKTIKKIMHRD